MVQWQSGLELHNFLLAREEMRVRTLAGVYSLFDLFLTLCVLIQSGPILHTYNLLSVNSLFTEIHLPIPKYYMIWALQGAIAKCDPNT